MATDNGEKPYLPDIAIVFLYMVAVGLNVIVVADAWTDGKFTKAIGEAWRAGKEKAAAGQNRERYIRQAAKEVVFEAIQIVDGETNNGH
jgi:hypothetical protein